MEITIGTRVRIIVRGYRQTGAIGEIEKIARSLRTDKCNYWVKLCDGGSTGPYEASDLEVVDVPEREEKKPAEYPIPEIKRVIFSGPCTIVIWEDGTKTIVRCQNEEFDPEKGLAMAFAKKLFGNKGKYYDNFKKWLPKEESEAMSTVKNAIKIFEKFGAELRRGLFI